MPSLLYGPIQIVGVGSFQGVMVVTGGMGMTDTSHLSQLSSQTFHQSIPAPSHRLEALSTPVVWKKVAPWEGCRDSVLAAFLPLLHHTCLSRAVASLLGQPYRDYLPMVSECRTGLKDDSCQLPVSQGIIFAPPFVTSMLHHFSCSALNNTALDKYVNLKFPFLAC